MQDNTIEAAPKSRKRSLVPFAIAGAAAAMIGAGAFAADRIGSDPLQEKVQKHFPNTKITSVRCKLDAAPKGLCEVVAGANVFYVSPDAKFAVVGSVLDLDAKLDLTDKRLRELAAVESAKGKIGGVGPEQLAAAAGPGPAGGPAPSAPGRPEAPQKVNVTLPAANGIVHNRGAALKMTVFTDYRCSYCNMLMGELRNAKDIEITEYPIAILGPESGEKAKLALCAQDRVAASNALYFGGDVKVTGDCANAQRLVEENTRYAQQNGIQGTPAIIRADGQMNPGYLPAAQLRAFLAQARG